MFTTKSLFAMYSYNVNPFRVILDICSQLFKIKYISQLNVSKAPWDVVIPKGMANSVETYALNVFDNLRNVKRRRKNDCGVINLISSLMFLVQFHCVVRGQVSSAIAMCVCICLCFPAHCLPTGAGLFKSLLLRGSAKRLMQ